MKIALGAQVHMVGCIGDDPFAREAIAGLREARVEPDGVRTGDAFTACLVVSRLEGRSWEDALRRACAAGAIAASRPGAQPSLPTAEEVDSIL